MRSVLTWLTTPQHRPGQIVFYILPAVFLPILLPDDWSLVKMLAVGLPISFTWVVLVGIAVTWLDRRRGAARAELD